jgi:hypothetical protein
VGCTGSIIDATAAEFPATPSLGLLAILLLTSP